MGKVGVGASRSLVVAVVGPTAAGKSAVGIELALQTRGEIISADARQVYRYMDIGTAKPSASDRSRVPHHLVDILEPNEDYNAGRFAEDARSAIRAVLGRGHLPVIVGGSGLYLRAALDGLFEGPPADSSLRIRLEALYAEKGEAALREELRAVDPGTEARIEGGKPRRLIRAIEVHALTGVPLSEHHRRQDRTVEFQVLWMGIMPSREELYRQIDLRVISMVEQGLVGEVRGLVARGFDRTMNALNTVGYREVFDMLEGATDEATMVRKIQDHTRQYAKRQMTWFRADGRIRWLQNVGRRTAGELASDIASAIGA